MCQRERENERFSAEADNRVHNIPVGFLQGAIRPSSAFASRGSCVGMLVPWPFPGHIACVPSRSSSVDPTSVSVSSSSPPPAVSSVLCPRTVATAEASGSGVEGSRLPSATNLLFVISVARLAAATVLLPRSHAGARAGRRGLLNRCVEGRGTAARLPLPRFRKPRVCLRGLRRTVRATASRILSYRPYPWPSSFHKMRGSLAPHPLSHRRRGRPPCHRHRPSPSVSRGHSAGRRGL